MSHPSNFRNLTGERFGRVVVLSYEGLVRDRRDSLYKCRCDCGTVFVTAARSLKQGACRSCGCIRKEKALATLESIKRRTVAVRVVDLATSDVHYFPTQTAAAAFLGTSNKTVWKHLHSGRDYKNQVIQRA